MGFGGFGQVAVLLNVVPIDLLRVGGSKVFICRTNTGCVVYIQQFYIWIMVHNVAISMLILGLPTLVALVALISKIVYQVMNS